MIHVSTRPIITLLTDFGYKDHYVAAMKAVILSLAPEAVVVDISHGIPKQDVRAGAYVLKSAYRYFPPGTIHVAVVDPGVGTARRGIVVKTRRYTFVGPDNGLLALAAVEDEVEEVRVIQNPSLMRPRVSYTFHGRDVFAPIAAHLARGVPLAEVGPKAEDGLSVAAFTRPCVERGRLECEALYIDDFGNVVLNATRTDVETAGFTYGIMCRVFLENSGRRLRVPFVPSYGYVEERAALLLINSEDFLELAVNRGSAAKRYELRPGDRVAIEIDIQSTDSGKDLISTGKRVTPQG